MHTIKSVTLHMVDWYASKNAWMTGEIHHQIMTKLNNKMRLSNHHILYVCDNASSHQVRECSHIKFLMLPPNATSIMQPLDSGYHSLSKYKKKLAERYLTCVENNKDANSLLKALDIVQATNMIAASWRETSSTIIQNCFCKAGFKHHAVDPASEIEEDPLPAPAPDVWNRGAKVVGWCAVWWICSQWTWDTYSTTHVLSGHCGPCSHWKWSPGWIWWWILGRNSICQCY